MRWSQVGLAVMPQMYLKPKIGHIQIDLPVSIHAYLPIRVLS